MTTKSRSDFVRQLGVLRIHVQNLSRGLKSNDIDALEQESQAVQDILLDLIKSQRRLPRTEQVSVKPHFVTIRKEALKCLELARKILDDSLQATLELVRMLDEANGYGGNGGGSSIMIDRKA